MNAPSQPHSTDEPRHHQRRDQRADVGAGVEDAGGEGPLLAREPLGDGLDRRREIAGLTEAEEEAGEGEAGGGAAERDEGDARSSRRG